MKYIIEIEDEPLVRESALHGETAVWKAKNFKSLVFDEYGLSMLTEYDEEAKREFERGCNTAWGTAIQLLFMEDRMRANIFGNGVSIGTIMLNNSAMKTLGKITKYRSDRKNAVKSMLYDVADKADISLDALKEHLEEMQDEQR